MPHLYCSKHGSEREAEVASQRHAYREEGESVLVVTGRLISGPWLCERCGDDLEPGDTAWLVSAFPGHMHDDLHEYDFGYERQYFAVKKTDQATVYGAPWPDGSIINRLYAKRKPPRRDPACALDLLNK